MLVIHYVCPLFLAVFILYVNPNVLFKMTKWEKTPLKSSQEKSYISKHSCMLTFNMIMGPFLATFLPSLIFTDNFKNKSWNLSVLDTLKTRQCLTTRIYLQMMFLCFLAQPFLMKTNDILMCFNKASRDNCKTRFKQWYFDISYKTCIGVSVFTFSLFYSVTMPQICLFTSILLCI